MASARPPGCDACRSEMIKRRPAIWASDTGVPRSTQPRSARGGAGGAEHKVSGDASVTVEFKNMPRGVMPRGQGDRSLQRGEAQLHPCHAARESGEEAAPRAAFRAAWLQPSACKITWDDIVGLHGRFGVVADDVASRHRLQDIWRQAASTRSCAVSTKRQNRKYLPRAQARWKISGPAKTPFERIETPARMLEGTHGPLTGQVQMIYTNTLVTQLRAPCRH